MTSARAIVQLHQIIYDDAQRFAVDRISLALEALERGGVDRAIQDLQVAADRLGQIDLRVTRAAALLDTPTVGAIQRSRTAA